MILWIRIPGSSGISNTVAAAAQGRTASELTEKIEALDPDMRFFDVYFLDEPDYFLFPGMVVRIGMDRKTMDGKGMHRLWAFDLS